MLNWIARAVWAFAQRKLYKKSPLLFGAYWLWKLYKGRQTRRALTG